MTEKQGTGIPKILRELQLNGSPKPEFDMDEERTYLNTIINMRDGFTLSDKMSDKMSDKEKEIFKKFVALQNTFGYVTTKSLAEAMDFSIPTARRYINVFFEYKIIKSEGNNKNRKYYLN